MTLLHTCILLRDFKSFQRLLDIHGRSGKSSKDAAGGGDTVKGGSEEGRMDRGLKYPGLVGNVRVGGDGGGFGHSPGQERSSPKHKQVHHPPVDSGAALVNVNDKDRNGRTALHLACSLPDCLEYVRFLLKHSSINVNVQDVESHYTPLHRALYVANLPAVLLLLQRPDIDTTLKDYEGYTAYDLYNSTIEGTKPDRDDPDGELFMWGANVNATLGFSDGNNRSHPDQIVIQPKEYYTSTSFPDPGPIPRDQFSPIHVRQVGMSKLHTVVVTREESDNVGGGNLRVCGFGSSGRLGPSPYHHAQQYALSPLPSHAFPASVHIVRVAVGQDHTLALTKSGEVYSWGFNRFAQLGYVVRTKGEGSSVPGSSSSVGGASGSHDAKTTEMGRWEGRVAESGIGKGESGKGASASLDDTMIQQTPRRVLDSLRKETVVGVAASKMASTCWTKKGDLYTWGANSGQLGYERASQPQVLPRKVSRVVGRVIDVALSDTAMACLVSTGDVICVWNDKESKINFPVQAFPAKIQPYRPPQALRDAGIAKLTTCDDVFAALSLNGEVFVFTAPDGSSSNGEGGNHTAGRTPLIKPQRAWVLKKKFRAVKDVALGSNGSIVVCTESGHVFVRTRSLPKGSGATGPPGDKGGSVPGSFTSSSLTRTMGGGMAANSSASSIVQPGKVGTNFSFVPVPCLQRVAKVYANSTGAFGALKVDYRHAPIDIVGNVMGEDLKEMMPFAVMYGGVDWKGTKKGGRSGLGLRTKERPGDVFSPSLEGVITPTEPEDADIDTVKEDVLQLQRFFALIEQEKKERKGFPKDTRLPFDADVVVISQSEAAFPVHRVVLAARSPVLCSVLSGGKVVKDEKANIAVRFVANKGKQVAGSGIFPSVSACGKLFISGCHPIAILILLTYLYSDELLALWDPRIRVQLQKECEQLKARPDQVRGELQTLARLLDLPLLSDALSLWVKRVPAPSMLRNMENLWSATQPAGQLHNVASVRKANHPLAPDVLLQLADREVWCYSVLLRARSDLFASFFGEEVWTVDRRDNEGVIKVDMRHVQWHPMRYVLRFMFCGAEEAQFDRLDFAQSIDDMLEFMFSVLAIATELLLDRLVLVCSSVILNHANIQNTCYVLNDATHYDAKQLVEGLQIYMAVNLETILEQRMLDDCLPRLVKQLGEFARQKQAEKSPISRTTVLADAAMEKHGESLALEDIPEPILPLNRPHGRGVNAASKRPRLSFSLTATNATTDFPVVAEAPHYTIRRLPSREDVFIMDDAPITDVSSPVLSSAKPSVWKSYSMLRVDMRSVMEEEAATVFASPPAKVMKTRPATSKDSYSTTPSPGSSLPRAPSGSWRVPTSLPMTMKKPTPPGTPPVAGVSQNVAVSRRGEGTVPTLLRGDGVSGTKGQPVRSQHQAATDIRSNLGPVISPARQQFKKTDTPAIHRVSGKAWTLPPVEPLTATSPTLTQASSSVPFATIQQLQLEEAFAGPSKDKRSLLEIQAEEEARQQEDDFLKWWTAEEERVRLESEAFSKAMTESMLGVGNARRKSRGGKSASQNQPSQGQPRDTIGAMEQRTISTQDRSYKPPRRGSRSKK